MAKFNQKIDSKYGVNTYQETKNTYDWLMKVIHSEDYSKLRIEEHFNFDIGKIGCVCDNFTEFVENAYGQEDYSFTAMSLSLYFSSEEPIFIHVSPSGNVSISAGNKTLLSRIVEKLENTNLASNEINDSISVAYIENQNNGVIIQGDKNRVSYAKNISNPPAPKWKQFIGTIFQNLVANWIWYLITIIATALFTSLALRK